MSALGDRTIIRPAIAALVLLAAVLSGFGWGVRAAEPRPGSQALARALQVQRQNVDRLLSLHDVVGTATGMTRDGKFVVKLYARRAGVAGVPAKLDGVPVVVEATGEFYALEAPRHRRPPSHRGPPRHPTSPRHPGPPRRPGPPGHGGPPADRDAPPEVTIQSPREGEWVSGEILVTAQASDDRGVASLEFYVDGDLLAADDDVSDGWSAVWDTATVADGQHTLAAVAVDTSGQEAGDEVSVIVDNQPGPFSPDGRPAPIGVSAGNASECSAGTIACRVRDAQGNVYALGNNHVFARLNSAAVGEAIVQPGLYDSGCAVAYSDQVIGLLYDFVPLQFGWRASNTVDAAIALCTSSDLGRSTPAGGYGTPRSAPVAAYVGQPVQKFGRTTFLTLGDVSGIAATVVVNYGTRSARFSNQIIVSGQGFIGAGDSGSLLVTHDPQQPLDGGRQPVGLLFAGNADGSTAIANPIQPVLDAFGVTIDGQ